jgi:hypothetical protein
MNARKRRETNNKFIIFYEVFIFLMPLNLTIARLLLLLRIQKIPGLNFGPAIGYHDSLREILG